METLHSAVTHVRLPDILHQRVRERCESGGIGISEWVRGLIVNALDVSEAGAMPKRAEVVTLDSTAPPYVKKEACKGVEKVERQEITLSNPQMSAYTS